MSFYRELMRRNVIKVGVAYVIVAWLILQVGEVLSPALLLPEWINSALAFFIILGFPVALIFAWAFELTPDGIKKEKDVDRTRSITSQTSQKLNYTIIALLLLALGYFVADKFVLQKSANPETAVAEERGSIPGRSIAVLPLADMSPQGDSEYFSDGLTEELLNILAKISELQVAGRTSSFAFKGKNEDLRDIGEKLNVATILEGSVRKDDARNRVRITLQLINAEDGYHLWSETYDRDLDDIFAIQEEVAHQVAQALRITLLGEDEERLDQVAKTDINAYDLYLQGLQQLHQGGYNSLETSIGIFENVLAMDSGFKPARLGLAEAYTQLIGTGAITIHEGTSKGLPLVESILTDEPYNAHAHALKAVFHASRYEDDLAETSFQRALELEPRNVLALSEYGNFLWQRTRIDEGARLIDAAVGIDPYAMQVVWEQCNLNARLGKLEAAQYSCQRVIDLEPDSPQGYYGMAMASSYSGNMAEAVRDFKRAIERDPADFEMLAGIAQYWLSMAGFEEVREWLDKAEIIGAGQPVPLATTAVLHIYQENTALAAEISSRALDSELDDRHGSHSAFRRTIALHAMKSEQPGQGLEPYRNQFPWAFEEELTPPDFIGWDIDDLIIIATLMRAEQPLSDRWRELMELCEENLEIYHPAWGPWTVSLRSARINTLKGNYPQAVEDLWAAARKGQRFAWHLHVINDPTLMALKDDPGMPELIAYVENDLAQQLEQARSNQWGLP